MSKSSRAITTVLSVVIGIMAIIGLAVGGIGSIRGTIADFYAQKNLEEIIKQTNESEGECLTDYIQDYSLSIYGLAEFYKDACVSITCAGWLGSGVCIASKGYCYGDEVLENGSYIVTNHHVIEKFYSVPNCAIKVYPNDYTNVERYGYEPIYSASLLWSDSYIDMALIYVEQNIDWVRMKDRWIEDSSLKRGEQAFVIGTPQEIGRQNTVTTGKIQSSEGGYAYTPPEKDFFGSALFNNIYEDLIPMNIPIEGGNSGGGLFDKQGFLIGLPTLGAKEDSSSSYAINYAVPIYPVTRILDNTIESFENEQEIFYYSLNDLNFVAIDRKESAVMDCFGGIYKNFYGINYKSSTLDYSGKGLKVIYLKDEADKVVSDEELALGKIINAVSVYRKNSDEVKELVMSEQISLRNDLIYTLLECREGDELEFSLSGRSSYVLKLA